MRRLNAAAAAAVAIGFGLFTLVGLLSGPESGLFYALTTVLLQVAAVTAAASILIGILNLLSVHWTRLKDRRKGWGYSLLLLLSTLLVLALVALERLGVVGGSPTPSSILFESVQVSIESALAGVVFFALVYGAYRMMRRRVSGAGILFTVVLLALLLGSLPLPGLGLLASVRDWLAAVPVSAGARGILLGIALATVVTGVRVLIGQDRSYRE